MSWQAHAIGGFGGAVVMTLIMSGSRGLGMTRIDIPFMLGTMFASDRNKARWIGFLIHLLNSWILTGVYFVAFGLHPGYWSYPLFGAAVGFIHALFVLTVGMSILPSIHPRMATEQSGPDTKRVLEPPGFFALNYGSGTPIITIVAHLIYGGILGWCFTGIGMSRL